MKKLSLALVIFIVSITSQLNAQTNLSSLQYSMGLATGDLGDFISKYSFRGATYEYRKLKTENIGVGFDIGWNVFYQEKNNETFISGTESLNGDQFRYSSNTPILFAVNYYTKPSSRINPYFGLGVGTEYSYARVDFGLYTTDVDAWHFALKPEVGVIMQTSPGMGVSISTKYYTAFKTQDTSERSYLAFNIGLVWQY